ncbi:MAG: sigma-70 family RNA polymerase sigma factor [Verrucomicrobiota bacterium]
MSELAIEEAVRRVQAGNVEEYRTIVAAFHQRLRTTIAALCPPGVEADEIAHLAFLQAYRRIDEYRSETNFHAWLVAIARYLLRTEYAQRWRRATNEQNYLEHLIIQRLDHAVTDDPGAAETLARFLAECLATLKIEAQSLLELRYREGLQVKVIADRLARSVTAVSVQLFGLRKLLRDCVARKQAHASANPDL